MQSGNFARQFAQWPRFQAGTNDISNIGYMQQNANIKDLTLNKQATINK